MKMKIYLFRFAVAAAAFVFGISVFSVSQYFQSLFSAKEQKTESIAPVKIETVNIEELVYPPRNIEQAENPVIEQTESTGSSVKENEYEFNAEGDYYIIGDLPKGFKDFDTLSISTKNYENISEENNWEGVPIPPTGYVFTKKEFKFVRINIANAQIAFKTETKKGISYEFVGEFIEEEKIEFKDKNGEEYTQHAVLKGRLKKMRDGKQIAESKVKFGISEGC